MALNSRYSRRILARRIDEQDGCCLYCRRPFTGEGPTRPTIEHRKAKMDGGRDHVANLAAACLHCNQHRGRQMERARRLAKGRDEGAPA
jgi:5-methylcytosine-specific restriction endonuclease McrA